VGVEPTTLRDETSTPYCYAHGAAENHLEEPGYISIIQENFPTCFLRRVRQPRKMMQSASLQFLQERNGAMSPLACSIN
jgi:hypothetical protein